MGAPKKNTKKYETPAHPWQAERINHENELIKKYGLKNKREIWRAQALLRSFRNQVRGLFAKLALKDKQAEKESQQLVNRLVTLGILQPNASLDDVLTLDIESILTRRLETIIYMKGLARTPKQARQLIVHGHIAVRNQKITIPSYMVRKDEENAISYYAISPLSDAMHPLRDREKVESLAGTGLSPARRE
jgi:small subunit ribosomal protein S4